MLKRSALIIWDAIKRNNIDKIREKLDEGFPIDHDITDSHLSVLSFACTRTTDDKIFQLILSKGPNLNLRSSGGRTPIHFAEQSGNQVALTILLA